MKTRSNRKRTAILPLRAAPIGDGLGRVTQVLEVIDDITAEVAAQANSSTSKESWNDRSAVPPLVKWLRASSTRSAIQ